MTESFDIPIDRFYDQEHHLWVLPEQESNVVRVGMDALGLASLGNLAYVKLEGAGKLVERGDSIVAECQNPGCRASSAIGTAVNGIAIGTALHPNPRTDCPLRRS